eukprot:4189703-Karenia_brevis.AAC.1
MSRRCTHRGSDVRLDTGSIFKPDSWLRKPINPECWIWCNVLAWRWQRQGHITELETRSVLSMIKWRTPSSHHLRTRFLHAVDSQGTLGVVTKG